MNILVSRKRICQLPNKSWVYCSMNLPFLGMLKLDVNVTIIPPIEGTEWRDWSLNQSQNGLCHPLYEGMTGLTCHMLFSEHTTILSRIDPICFSGAGSSSRPLSGGVLGHQLLGEAEKVAESCPELPCCISIMLLASRYVMPHFSSVNLLSVLKGALKRLCPSSRSVCSHDYLRSPPCEYSATRCQYHSRRYFHLFRFFKIFI